MTLIGHVRELWRYPVKSMQGERVERTQVVGTFGVSGDRGWAVRDDDVGEIRSGRKLPGLLGFAARYLEEPDGASTPAIELTFPDGNRHRSGEPGLDDALSAALEHPVSLWPRMPAEDHDHYRRVEEFDEDVLRIQLGLLPEEPMPDYSDIPEEVLAELNQYVGPLGTYFDTFELSLMTSASLGTLARQAPDSVIDTRRFRQNVIVDTGDTFEGYPEVDWSGRRVRIGSVVADIVMPIMRCSIVTLPHGDVPRDRSLMRTLVREAGQDMGVYLRLVEPGEVAEGDPVEMLTTEEEHV